MTWTNKLRMMCSSAVNVGIDYALTFLDGVGSLASTIGGAGMAVGSIIEEEINPSYYGQVETPGELTVQLGIPSIGFNINQSLAFDYTIKQEGQLFYNSNNYLTPQSVMMISGVLFLGGTLLKVITASMAEFREYRVDKEFFKKNKGINFLSPPIGREYRYASTAALYRSVSYASVSYVIVSAVFSFSSLRNAIQRITYPSSGDRYIDGEYYKGPTTSTLYPVSFDFQKNVTFNFPFIDLIVQETAHVAALANITYGGGVFFKAKDKGDLPIIVPIIVAVSTDQLCRFFNRKALHERDARIREAQDNLYSPI